MVWQFSGWSVSSPPASYWCYASLVTSIPPKEMTYKELLAELQKLNEEQLNQDVAVWDSWALDEYYQASVEFVFATEECDVLDIDHPIIRF